MTLYVCFYLLLPKFELIIWISTFYIIITATKCHTFYVPSYLIQVVHKIIISYSQPYGPWWNLEFYFTTWIRYDSVRSIGKPLYREGTEPPSTPIHLYGFPWFQSTPYPVIPQAGRSPPSPIRRGMHPSRSPDGGGSDDSSLIPASDIFYLPPESSPIPGLYPWLMSPWPGKTDPGAVLLLVSFATACSGGGGV